MSQCNNFLYAYCDKYKGPFIVQKYDIKHNIWDKLVIDYKPESIFKSEGARLIPLWLLSQEIQTKCEGSQN